MKNKTLKNYYQACFDLAEEFNKIYFNGVADKFAIGGELDGVWGINDYFFDIQQMAQAIEWELTEEELFDWYEQWVDVDEVDQGRMNIKNYAIALWEEGEYK